MAACEILSLYVIQYKDQISISFPLAEMKEFAFNYDFYEENSAKFMAALQKEWQGSLEQMVREGFVHTTAREEYFEYLKLEEFCKKNGIQYKFTQEFLI